MDGIFNANVKSNVKSMDLGTDPKDKMVSKEDLLCFNFNKSNCRSPNL